ncbi:MAG: alpha/beta hydrolase [Bacillales bacterium]|nr:alpha/beta hydrolase [Bacillales bacterium]
MEKYVKKHLSILNIPAIEWGNKSDSVFIYVHGLESSKEDKNVTFFAYQAVSKGYQVLSFDLPGHGDRIQEGIRCKVQDAVRDLKTILDYAKNNWQRVSLYAVSIGAYFSLLAYRDETFDVSLFQTPLVDMERMIKKIMKKSNISLERLEKEKEIRTYFETLYWDYYQYIIAHQIDKWDSKTYILYGENDGLVDKDTIEAFSKKFNVEIEISKGSEHFFNTDSDYEQLKNWILEHI